MSASKAKSKFTGLFQRAAEEAPQVSHDNVLPPAPGRIEHPAEEPADAVALPEATEVRPAVQRSMVRRAETQPSQAKPMGRPPGKRSDPSWKQFSVLLQKDTHKQAANILRDKDDGSDLSSLVQSLLEAWIKKQTK